MPEAKRPLKVFLCHAHADRDAVRALYARLTKDGVDAWLDKEKLLPGQDWELEIRKAVREADVVVVCLSKQFNQAGFRQKEVRLALDTAMEKPEGEIFIIPARLEECDTLESLRKWHWVDLFDDDGYEMLMRALRARANKIDATLQINRTASERKEYESSENADNERTASELDKVEQEKVEKEVSKAVEDVKRQLKRNLFFIRLRNIRNKFFLYLRYYIFPAILVLGVIAVSFYVAKPYLESSLPSIQNKISITPQPSLTIIQTDVPSTVVFETASPTHLPTEITDTKSLGKIAFTSDNCVRWDTCQDIYLVNTDGSEQKNLTLNSLAPYNYSPEFSPDGTKLLFIGGYPYDSDNLFMIDLESLEITLIKEFQGAARGNSGLSWSLDGENVVYDVYVDNDIRNIVETFNLKTQVTMRLTNNNEDDDSPSWSFDGNKIVFSFGTTAQHELYMMNPDGTNRQLLLNSISCLGPRFSPVNFQIVMYCGRNGWDLFIFDAISKQLISITNFPSDEKSPSWSPDGEWIVFESNMDDPNYQTCSPKDGDTPCNNEIYIVRSDGSNLTRLTFNKDDDGDPVWGR